MSVKLATRLSIITCSVLVLTMLGDAIINIREYNRVSFDEAMKDADNLSETIARTSRFLMLDNHSQGFYTMMGIVGEQQGIECLRLFNKEGVVTYSTRPEEIGMVLDKEAEGCNACHQPGQKTRSDVPMTGRSRVFYDAQGRKLLGMTKEISNHPSCSTAACHAHPPENPILGTLDLQISLAETEARAFSFRNHILGLTLSLIILLSLTLTLVSQRLIARPVGRLLAHVRRLSRGQYDSRVAHIPPGELGDLVVAFNDMAANLKYTRDELTDLASSLEVKVEERTREIEQMQGDLVRSEKLASIGKLVAGIAHEINNPLTGILLFASMIERNPRFNPEFHDDLSVIVKQAQRCALIVRELLEFSRETKAHRECVSLNLILDKTLSLLQHQADFQNIDIRRNYDWQLPEVFVDVNQLEQVFMNMMINASQAMPHGGILDLSTETGDDTGTVLVVIRDTGTGIDAEHLDKIFDPFFTTKEATGTGLGLSVSHGIIEAHGGSISVESQKGVETVFRIVLPVGPCGSARLIERSVDDVTAN
jgi:two-component system NtrC family sensor kinase